MKKYVALIAYDGTAYYGFQKTKEGPSIEESLETILQQIFQHPISLQAASRTDRGVHAEGQVVDWNSPKDLDCTQLNISLNQLLPPDIRVLNITNTVDISFHPTLDATSKHYLYCISNTPVQLPKERLTHWHIIPPLDTKLMQKASHSLIGTHDFKSFCNARKDLRYETTIRTITGITIEQRESEITVHMMGNAFLYKMARNIVGTLVYVGLQKIPIESLTELLEAKNRPGIGITAPAHGLFLKELLYVKWPHVVQR